MPGALWRIAIVAFGTVLALIWTWWRVAQPMWIARPASPVGQADPQRLEKAVRMLVGAGPRDAAHPASLGPVAGHIKDALRPARARGVEQAFPADGNTYRNVIASFGPEAGPRLVVGAHYDTCMNLPGADDNASGVAGLLELARLLAPRKLALRVDLVAYCLEEPPYFRTPQMGSCFHAQSLKRERVEVRVMICLEMIGCFSAEPGSQAYPLPGLSWCYPSQGDFIGVVGCWDQTALVRQVKRAMILSGGPPVYSINAPRLLPGVDFSDHRNYWDAGYPAVMITDTAFYRNRNYHTSRDTPDLLDYRRMAQVADQVLAVIGALCDAAAPTS